MGATINIGKWITIICLLAVAQVKGQGVLTEGDECALSDAKMNLLASVQRSFDSVAQLNARLDVKQVTQSEAIPVEIIKNIQFSTGSDHIHGFFNGINNANHYLIIVTTDDQLNATPVDGIQYRPGDALGSGRVIGSNGATVFSASGLHPLTTYKVFVFAANDNSIRGILYNASPAYVGKITTGSSAPLNYYYGTLHSHSSYSDGNKDNLSLIPADDYGYAKNSLCMDFLGIAEHNHFSSTRNPGMHVASYQPGIQQADSFTANNPGFLALYGMEWGVINNGGHLCIYGIDSLIGWETLNGSPNYNIFVSEYNYRGTGGLLPTIYNHKRAFGSLAHPNTSDYSGLATSSYDPIADSALIGCAVESGPAFSTNTTYSDPASMSYLSYYLGLLTKGYHLGPWIDHDTHNLTFGRATNARLVVLAPTISKNDFFDAMLAMHFYATENCNTQVDFEVDSAIMGSDIARAGAPSILVTANNATTSTPPVIQLYCGHPGSNSPAIIISTVTGNTLTYTDNGLNNNTNAYYYADIRMGSSRTITSPIWYQRNDALATSVSVIPNLLANNLIIKGNPLINNQLSATIIAAKSEEVMITLTDLTGKLLLTAAVKANAGENNLHLSLIELATGTYFLSAGFENGRITKMILK